jgi:hypothetical protein
MTYGIIQGVKKCMLRLFILKCLYLSAVLPAATLVACKVVVNVPDGPLLVIKAEIAVYPALAEL